MITIIKEENYEGVCAQMGYTPEKDAVIMSVKDKDMLMGIGAAKIYDGYASLDELLIKDEYKSFELEYGLGKSLLNLLDLRGICKVVSNNKSIEKQLFALRFKPVEEDEDFDIEGNWKYCLNLEGYFTSNC